MRNILNIFSCDLRALRQNVVSVILAVGLVIMPSMFVWYNVLACWDVFGNTGNLKVAVANTDAGYKSELLPMDLNIGDQVTNALRANDQMNWVFTDKDDAIDGAASGRYYAALVIPESFSQEMMTFYTSDVERAPIIYYSNEKKSAIAPKVTDQGADRISYQVNKVFAETLSEVLLNIVNSAISLNDDGSVSENIDTLIERLGEASERMRGHTTTLESYIDIMTACQSLTNGSETLINDTQNSINDVYTSLDGTKESTQNLISALDSTASSLTTALSQSVQNYENTSQAIDVAFQNSNTTAKATADTLYTSADNINQSSDRLEEIAKSLETLSTSVPEAYKPTIEQFAALMQSTVDLQRQSADALTTAGDNITTSNEKLQTQYDAISEKMNAAVESLRSTESTYQNNVKPKLDALSDKITQVADNLSENSAQLASVGDNLSSSLTNADSKLEKAKSSVSLAIAKLNSAASNLDNIKNKIVAAREAGGVEAVKDLIGDDPSLLAENLAAPIGIERIAEFPSSTFGAAMSPLYATLGLWVGALLSVVLIKTNPNERTLASCSRKPHLHEIFLGRFGVFALISIFQSLVMAFGNLVFLEIQVTDPLLYILCFLVSGLVFQFIMYTFVASFGNVGKAIGVLLLIVQVTGAGGSFPLQLLPDYATIVNPFLPATYTINAMRASMFGLYGADFWVHLAKLLLFLLPMLLIGLILRRPFVKMNEKFVERVEKSKLI